MGFKPEMDRLRERMRGLGFSYDEVAAEVSRRHPGRPRQALSCLHPTGTGRAAHG